MPTTSQPADHKQKQPERQPDHSVHCPNCSTRLTELKCKLLCKKCGYYMSCADFY
jgi:hypothetical protein